MSADTATGPNHSLFVQVLAQIEREPQRWWQGGWRSTCGTAHCFAGWAVELTGAAWANPQRGDIMVRYVKTDRGGYREVGRVACDRLGLLPSEAGPQRLFLAHNTLADLYRISADILGIDEQVLREKVAAEVADGSVQP
jgi:hypothetical protein